MQKSVIKFGLPLQNMTTKWWKQELEKQVSQFNAWEAYNFNHNKMGSENQDIIVTKK